MTRRNSLESENENNNNNNEKQHHQNQPTRKRIRDNHNEMERARRNQQKAHLEALRVALPFQDMDEKASMVSIFIRAREYIGMLEQRIVELQSASGTVPSEGMTSYFNQMASSMSPRPPAVQLPLVFQQPASYSPQHQQPQAPSSPSYIRERNLSVNPDHIQIHHGIPFYNPGFLNSTNSQSNIDTLITPNSSPIRKPSSPLSDRNFDSSMVNADLLRSFVSDSYLKSGGVKRLSAQDEDEFLRTFYERRSSTLLMPMNNHSVMVQKRDSLSALFSGLLPDIVESSTLNSNDIKCAKCQKGMCNMIMIDCDKCHKWYHIKCAQIDSNSIPTFWNCCS